MTLFIKLMIKCMAACYLGQQSPKSSNSNCPVFLQTEQPLPSLSKAGALQPSVA